MKDLSRLIQISIIDISLALNHARTHKNNSKNVQTIILETLKHRSKEK